MNNRLNLRLSESLKSRLEKEVEKQGRNVSALAREALELYLEGPVSAFQRTLTSLFKRNLTPEELYSVLKVEYIKYLDEKED